MKYEGISLRVGRTDRGSNMRNRTSHEFAWEHTSVSGGWKTLLVLAWVHLFAVAAVEKGGNEGAPGQPKDPGVVHDELGHVLSRAVIDLQRRQGELDCMYERLGQVVQKNAGKGSRKDGWASGHVVSSNGAFCAFADSAKGYLDYRKKNFFHDFADAMAKWLHSVCDGQCLVAELGASSGLYGAYWRKAGVNVTSYDGTAGIATVTRGHVQYMDLSSEVSRVVYGKRYDFTTCVEVLEHIPKTSEDAVVKNIAAMTRLGAIITWARPGQGGNHHVNERPKSEVVTLFEQVGLFFCPNTTQTLQSRIHTKHLRENLLVLRTNRWSCN